MLPEGSAQLFELFFWLVIEHQTLVLQRAGPSEVPCMAFLDLHPEIHGLQADYLVQGAADGRLHCFA